MITLIQRYHTVATPFYAEFLRDCLFEADNRIPRIMLGSINHQSAYQRLPWGHLHHMALQYEIYVHLFSPEAGSKGTKRVFIMAFRQE